MAEIEFLSEIPEELKVFIIAMFPVGELRAAIPIAVNSFGMTAYRAYLWSVLGNIVPVFFIIFFLERISEFLSSKFAVFNRFFEWLFERTRRKHGKRFELYQELALLMFVAVPLPVTGAWSGSVAAFVFGIPPKKAIPFIIGGVMIAGVIVTLITEGVTFFI